MPKVQPGARSDRPAAQHSGRQTLRFPAPHFAAMLDHLQAALPAEGCGFLATKAGNVVAVFPVENELARPDRFCMAARPMVAALTAIVDKGWEIGAVYHSHPAGPAQLSPHDLAELNYREALQIVVSLADPEAPHVAIFSVDDVGIYQVPWQIV